MLQSKREAMFYYPDDPNDKYGLFAVRVGKYKAHYYTRGEFPEVSSKTSRSNIIVKIFFLILIEASMI